ncbi:hypothetical protein BDR26DRAFT_853895 [Obelidium mucronatum]|nr:hypothetical protein BDR26DRAFT_853895 [Obelidium mucronatum]
MTVIDDHLLPLPQHQKSGLQRLREQIIAIVPNAQECISYGLPCFKVEQTHTAGATGAKKKKTATALKAVCGFAALTSKKSQKPGALSLAYYPFSGQTLAAVKDHLQERGLFNGTKSSLHFSAEKGLPDDVVALLIETRLREINGVDGVEVVGESENDGRLPQPKKRGRSAAGSLSDFEEGAPDVCVVKGNNKRKRNS